MFAVIAASRARVAHAGLCACHKCVSQCVTRTPRATHPRTFMTRAILDEAQIHPAARPLIGSKHQDIVREVQAAIAAHQVVVVGMALNPFPRKARKILDVLGTLPVPAIRQLSEPVASPQCLENVDGLAHVSHGLCQWRAHRWRQRAANAGGEWRVQRPAGEEGAPVLRPALLLLFARPPRRLARAQGVEQAAQIVMVELVHQRN